MKYEIDKAVALARLPNERLKFALLWFWNRFGGKKSLGMGFPQEEKLAALVALSFFQVKYHKQQSLDIRRAKFDDAKAKLHPWKRFFCCFVCGDKATDRHHIIQLQFGGINSKKNLVSLCSGCHGKIHPWMNSF